MPETSGGKPNTIIVYTDQHRYDALGISGNPLIRTPNLDRFGREGVQFTRGYVTTPICLPSRVGLFTGRYNHTNLSYLNSTLMLERETDLPKLFKEAGYTTALIGKDHCFGQERLPRSFDHLRLAGHVGFGPPLDEAERRVGEVRKGKMQVPFADDPVSPDESVTGRLFQSARDYVRERAAEPHGDRTPFLLWLSIPDPHPPYMVCEPYASMYDDVEMPAPAWREGEMAGKPYRQQKAVEWNRYDTDYPGDDIDRLRRIYWGMVSYIDDEMGKLMRALAEAGIDEDTLVLFTADHGDYMGDHRMIRKGPHVYEALVHVPFMVRWPGHVAPRATDAMVTNVDVFPTLCELAGVAAPPHVQGRSFAPVLRGERDAHNERVFLEHGSPGHPLQPGELSAAEDAEHAADSGHHLGPTVYRGRTKAVRSERWKYTVTPGDVDQLYDLEVDPNELHNRAADPACAEIVSEHQRYILDWLIETEDTLLA